MRHIARVAGAIGAGAAAIVLAAAPDTLSSAPARSPGQAAAAAAVAPYTETIPGTSVTFDMVPIPGGTFTMGSPATEPFRADDEGPPVKVTVAPFWMGKLEVTWSE